jgi:hypothetical protein
MPEPLHRRVQNLLLKGAAPEDVMDILGLTPSTYAAAIARITRLSVDAVYAQRVLELELQRLDVLQSSYWDQAVQGQFDALAAVLNIMRRRASYLGLDAPVQAQSANSSFVDVLASLSSHPAAQVQQQSPPTLQHEETPPNDKLN